jgi:DNA-3-methyladenine glycosylase II
MTASIGKEGSSLSCAIELPDDFRRNDILAFHRRDPLMAAERVDASTLQKGLVWEGLAACLTIRFYARHADAELAIDGSAAEGGGDLLERMVRRMLGLTQRTEEFEQAFEGHPHLAPLIARHPGLRVPLAATPVEALTGAVTGQQISVKAAISLRRKLIQASGFKHSG